MTWALEEMSLNHGRKTVRGTVAQKSLTVYDTDCVTPFHSHRLIDLVVWITNDGRVMERGELTEEREDGSRRWSFG